MKKFWILPLILFSTMKAFAAAPILYVPADSLLVDFSSQLPGANDKINRSANLFDLILNKTAAMWRSEDGKNICILADSGSPVPENIIKEAKSYGYVFKNDPNQKICHHNLIKIK